MGYHIIGSDLTEVTFIDEGTTVVLEDTGDTLELGGELNFVPTVTSTAHINTTGSLRVRATDNMHIGDALVDSIRIGRDNTTAAKVHIRSGSDTDLVVSDGKVGIGMDDPSHSLEIDGDIQLSPTAISTAHISSAGSLKIDADSNMQIGHTLVDSVRIGRVNTGLVKVHVRSGADTDLVVSNSMVGIGTDSPAHTLDVAGDVDISGGLSFDAGTAVTSIDTDISSVSGSDDTLASAKAIKTYVDSATGGGDITAVTAGVGLSGGGASGDVTLTLDLSELATVAPADGDTFATLDSDGANEQKTTTTALATLLAGTGLTAASSVIGVDASQTQITGVGTITTGTWTGTAIASAYLDSDTAHLSGTQTFSGAKSFDLDVSVGGGAAGDRMVKFDGNAQDYRVGIDDGTDILEIGNGTTMGASTALGIDSAGQVGQMRLKTNRALHGGVGGGGAVNAYTVLVTDNVIFVDDTSNNAKTVTFPLATEEMDGQVWFIKDMDNCATNNITVAVASGDYFENTENGTYTMDTQRMSIRVVCRWVSTLSDGKFYII